MWRRSGLKLVKSGLHRAYLPILSDSLVVRYTHWASAHLGLEGNEFADFFTKIAGRERAQQGGEKLSTGGQRRTCDEGDDRREDPGCRGVDPWARQAQLAIQAAQGNEPPPRAEKERKELTGRYCQLLSGHVAAGAYLANRVHKIPSNVRWWCGSGEWQSRYDLFADQKVVEST